MSQTYDNNMRFALFKQEQKEKDGDADYTGTITVNGQEFWMNAWMNKSKKGVKYLSGSIKPKETRGGGSKSAKRGREEDGDDW